MQCQEDTDKLISLTGQTHYGKCEIELLRRDSKTYFVKTHDLPQDDNLPAVTLIRDGRDAMVSYAYFSLKTDHGIDRPSRDQFEATLKQIITGETFGGWSRNVDAWINRVGPEMVIRYEDLIEDPINILAGTLGRLGLCSPTCAEEPPSFEELHDAVPWFFRRGKAGSWREEMPPDLQNLFLERHGETLLRLGYPDKPSLSVRAAKHGLSKFATV